MRRIILLNLLLFPALLFGFEVVRTDFSQYLGQTTDTVSGMLQSATDSAPPKQMNDLVVFMKRPENRVRYIGISFAHEDFRKIHLFSRQDEGVFYYLYKVTGELKELNYRMVVDGVWRADDTHEDRYSDPYGHQISRFELNTSVVAEDIRPQILDNGEVLFRYRGSRGSKVFLNSDIGSWDPFLFRMTEVRPGFFETRVRMTEGQHYYYFIENGRKMLGNVSLDTRIHRIEGEVNQLFVD